MKKGVNHFLKEKVKRAELYEFINLYRRDFSIERMAKIFGVSRSAYYQYSRGNLSKKEIINSQLRPLLIKAFINSKGEYGTRRLQLLLRRLDIYVGRKRIAKLMKELGLYAKARRKFKVTTNQSKRPYYVAPNLLKQKFMVEAPNEVWVSDITYVPTNEGWLYVATVVDLFSRKVVGLAMSQRITADLVLRAVNQAVKRRQPDSGLILHSDRGSQYTSRVYHQLTKKHRIRLSMSSTVNCYDNAVAESFFHTLKLAVVHDQKYQTRNQAMRCIFEYVEVFYNRQRMHSTLNYLSPEEFERNYFNQPQYPIAKCLVKG
ncbi:IS3 family transposase [bacterium SCSIO 12844]|nr:IS3 family transposase [bacterium SCSIO 12844]UTW44037.1 IS3 family transposase [bacterium SCSIO 12844]